MTADFNNDGHLDLATANPDDGTVSVLLGDGQGGFGAAINSAVGCHGYHRLASRSPTSTTTAISTWRWHPTDGLGGSCRVNFLLGNGDGTFQTPVTLTNDRALRSRRLRATSTTTATATSWSSSNDPEWDYG